MTELAKKLHIKEGQSILILNEPVGYRERLEPLPEGAEYISDAGEGMADFVQLFVKSVADLEEWVPRTLRTLRYDGLFWVTYPKKASGVETDIHRDQGWESLTEADSTPSPRFPSPISGPPCTSGRRRKSHGVR
ncbi:hypothetical protein C8P63_11360 [Melghirimyces profundicolus]|uniref:Uncharacterized protein n=1 Tax=Melghirimyces profundicolus TaxID=1242148 RepID=A0A2T6BSP4_9BACL|nr:hypothetical protein [Melghirimyces profundicolus]PTX59115.1 hypothetical protein C8P63_11360 [Melghirimyces profundicolus]